MAKSRHEDTGESAPKGTARRTLSKAHFFLAQADRSERYIEAYECYVEAAILFGAAALEHLRKEFGRKRRFARWIELREQNPLIKGLLERRNTISHERTTSIIPSLKDAFYMENPIDEAPAETRAVHGSLREQLDAVEAIIDDCQKQYF
jgi:hypothetical protein